MKSEYDELISMAECFQIDHRTWFAYITKTKYVCAIGDTKRDALEFLSENLKVWLSLGKPKEVPIEDMLEITKQLCKELTKLEKDFEADKPSLDRDSLKGKSEPEVRMIELSTLIDLKNLDNDVWLMGANADAPLSFRFTTHKTHSGGYICSCSKIYCDVICYDKDELLDKCTRAVADAIDVEEHHINVVIEEPSN
jgi:hypothetical protein